MMRKYFPLEASERLFVAVEEDDVVDAQGQFAADYRTKLYHRNHP